MRIDGPRPSETRSPVFEPGMRLMDRLRYPQKFLLIGLIFFLPLAVVAILHYSEQREAIQAYQLRLSGLAFIRQVSEVLRAAEMQQALTVAVLDGDDSLRPRRVETTQRLEHALSELESRTASVKAQFDVTEVAARIRPQLERALAASRVQDALKEHIALVTTVQDLITNASDRSHLQLEEDAVIFRLVSLITGQRRLVTQRITTLWCLDDLARRGVVRVEQKADIETLPDLVRLMLTNIGKTFNPNGRHLADATVFFDSLKAAREATLALLAATEKDANSVPFELFDRASAANWNSYDVTAVQIERMLRAQVEMLRTREVWTLAAIVGGLLVVSYLFSSFYLSTLRTVKLLEHASRRMVDEDVVEQVSTRTHDEMGEVVEAFNQVAQRLKVELAQARAETLRATVAESALRESEEKLREALVAAESANTAKSQFLANMSHELRTPLNAIIGYSEMLEEEATDRALDDMVPDLHRILGAARHLLALINDILDISKIEAGKMEVFRENIEVDRMLDDVLSTINPLAQKNANTLEVIRQGELGHIYSDITKIRQSLLNLLSNACKFTEKGTIRLEARMEERFLVFAVTDSGIGMSAEQVGKLFQEFSQADASTTRKYGGTGLGLAISRRFCQMLGGDIEVRSEPGHGSTFTMRVLATDAVPTVVSALESRADGGGLILIIDDDPAALDLLSRFLRKEGFEVLTARSGEEGLKLAREHHPNVISLDIMLPGMDGWQVLDVLKSDPELAEIPVIILTMLDDQQRGYALGATEFLVKPLDRERLSRIVRRYRVAGRAARVLLIEDDPDIRQLLSRQLTTDGWSIETAENGAEGLQRCAAAVPDLILLDLMMPVMDGFEFVNRLRQSEAGRTVPVVVITARDLSADDRARLNGHVDRILQKAGQNRDDLLGEVRGMLSRIQASASRA